MYYLTVGLTAGLTGGLTSVKQLSDFLQAVLWHGPLGCYRHPGADPFSALVTASQDPRLNCRTQSFKAEKGSRSQAQYALNLEEL